ncbi:16S rRNA (guanine(527)-N(7))-methyltransferase RsmG [Neptunomonas marina]|uniref:Ribosomal RNA small subunit methyltransferase G n=1 Tax=Neptunomonas marina TaxID=1815562 RepID=A0A437QBI6_9GAMM|nr:16S rRNA (guanine(527)-N(7))-methyltransferase RsmG [Neptunomonas marina]RVU31759.1 16S rRNA (guanine(527)-N(7))-methyltransferase RsmG [Neptunomonas marina]
MDLMSLRALLEQQATALSLNLTDQQIDQLINYLELLIKWNKAYNLTAVRDPSEMVSRHLVDSLSVVPFVRGPRIIDVGSGPGLPGIPLAICLPNVRVVTLDSNGKKTRFQNHVKVTLGLDNLAIINGRAEECDEPAFPEVISRAFASLEDMITWTQQLCADDGVFLAMKGQYPDEELAALPAGFELKESHPLLVPGTDGTRHLLVLGRE